MTHQRYLEYRDSGVPCLRKIPGHWSVLPGRLVTQAVQRPPNVGDGTVTAFRDGQVTLRSKRRTEGFTEVLQEIGYQGVRSGELVIHGMDGFAGAIGVSDSDGKMSPVVHIYRTPHGDPRYLAHCLRVAASAGYVQSLAKGIRERSTSFDRVTFRGMAVPFPPYSEQVAIADYLDRETAQIDTLVEDQQRLIDMLGERRSSVISHALVEAAADRVPLRRVVNVIDCAHVTAEFVDDDDRFPVASIRECAGPYVNLSSCNYTTADYFTLLRASGRAPRVGDLLFIRNVSWVSFRQSQRAPRSSPWVRRLFCCEGKRTLTRSFCDTRSTGASPGMQSKAR